MLVLLWVVAMDAVVNDSIQIKVQVIYRDSLRLNYLLVGNLLEE